MNNDSNIIELKAGEHINIKGEPFLIEEKLGQGGFSAVYLVRSQSNKRKIYAMKTESRDAAELQVLKVEVDVLQQMALRDTCHFCRIYDKGRTTQYSYIIMTCVGKSLAELRKNYPGDRFTLSTALRVAIQTMESIRELHDISYLHRDIKPGNFTIGRADNNDLRTVYMLDFGMSRHYRSSSGHHKKAREKCEFRGTVRYASLHTHRLEDQSRRDDIESWLYLTIEITRGSLQWKSTPNQQDVQRLKEDVRKSPDQHLGEKCPLTYRRLLTYVDSLQFTSRPDYDWINSLLSREMYYCGSRWEHPYDWESLPERSAGTVNRAERKSVVNSASLVMTLSRNARTAYRRRYRPIDRTPCTRL